MAVLMDYLCCGNYTKGFECGNGWSDKETAAGLWIQRELNCYRRPAAGFSHPISRPFSARHPLFVRLVLGSFCNNRRSEQPAALGAIKVGPFHMSHKDCQNIGHVGAHSHRYSHTQILAHTRPPTRAHILMRRI